MEGEGFSELCLVCWMDVLGDLEFAVVMCNMEGVYREVERVGMVVRIVVDRGVLGGGAFFGVVVDAGGITGVMA